MPGAFALQLVETFGQLVEGQGDLAEFVGPLDTGAGRAVAGLESTHGRFEPGGIGAERARCDERQHGREHRGHDEQTEDRAGVAVVEDHQPARR